MRGPGTLLRGEAAGDANRESLVAFELVGPRAGPWELDAVVDDIVAARGWTAVVVVGYG